MTGPVGTGRAALLVAGLLGTLHAGFSLYWGLGGGWLVETLGTRIVEAFAGWEWALVPIGVVKLVAAWFPMVVARRGWPARRLVRAACWVGALVLLAWGGLNTVVGNLVLAGAIVPDGGFDRPGMVGHAYLWDPLFAAWGCALLVAMVVTRRPSPAGPDRSLPTRS
ncbi:hypothetical protein F4692_003529 [Nocardioides cavernae]|uniref:DUF3995 domain-containing protein n=1 Tax=Nocardioides cavernae TaxID=1921566 RepID=A0A7Y9KR56_9ACTN|nr:DUF3995 domain-containing protein [Nocardioides cavernae]NYE38381.1 hypothetical protein [Nocardioides cavernae]